MRSQPAPDAEHAGSASLPGPHPARCMPASWRFMDSSRICTLNRMLTQVRVLVLGCLPCFRSRASPCLPAWLQRAIREAMVCTGGFLPLLEVVFPRFPGLRHLFGPFTYSFLPYLYLHPNPGPWTPKPGSLQALSTKPDSYLPMNHHVGWKKPGRVKSTTGPEAHRSPLYSHQKSFSHCTGSPALEFLMNQICKFGGLLVQVNSAISHCELWKLNSKP